MKNKFKIGDVVTIKSHPLNCEKIYGLVKGDIKRYPPFMIIGEVHFSDNNKKIYDSATGKKIGSKIRYKCFYFDTFNYEFNESFHYEEFLIGYEKIKYHNKTHPNKKKSQTLVEELQDKFKKSLKYEFGEVVSLRTFKLEGVKKRALSKKDRYKYEYTFMPPNFQISGFAMNKDKCTFFDDGSPKSIISEKLLKVRWFNYKSNKFSEKLLPFELFCELLTFEYTRENNQSTEEE